MMLTGTIIDFNGNDPLPGTTVEVLTPTTNNIFSTQAADQQGQFSLNIPDSTYKIHFSHVGYYDNTMRASDIDTTGTVIMVRKEGILPAVIVTPGNKKYVIPGIILAALLIYYLTRKKKGKVGAVNWENLILPGGIVIAGFLILYNLGFFGKGKSDAQKSDTDATVKSLEEALKRWPKTYSDANYTGWADDIYLQGANDGGSAAQQAIINDIMNCKNLTDLLMIKQAFGWRDVSLHWYSLCAILSINCPKVNLDSFLKQVLDTDNIATVNNYLDSNDINYQF